MDPAKGSWGHSAAWGSRPRSVPGFGVPDAQGSDGSHSRWAEWLWGLRPFDLQAGGRDHPWRPPGRLSSDRSARPLGACASSPCLPHPSPQGAGAGGKRNARIPTPHGAPAGRRRRAGPGSEDGCAPPRACACVVGPETQFLEHRMGQVGEKAWEKGRSTSKSAVVEVTLTKVKCPEYGR